MNKIKTKTLILGAGIGGLGAGWTLKENKESQFLIVDSAPGFVSNLHNGVHYLHSIPELEIQPTKLKEVTLTDGVVRKYGKDGAEIADRPTLMDSLNYSKKVREIQHPSSIMDIGKRTSVFLPEDNNMNTYTEAMYKGIGDEHFMFGCEVTIVIPEQKKVILNGSIEVEFDNCISTLPLNMVIPGIQLNANPVYITNCKVSSIVPNWLINLYIPNTDTRIYRMSLLNGIASFESVGVLGSEEITAIPDMFGMFDIDVHGVSTYTWKTGKVMSISTDERRCIVERLVPLGWYQIGRFGLWNRKLLMDSTIEQAVFAVTHIDECVDTSTLIEKLVN